MPLSLVTRDTAEYLLLRERNWSRFQRFCVDLMSEAEHIPYAASALSHDLGRDGRTPLISTASLEAVICSSVKIDAKGTLSKATTDLKRLIETGAPNRVTFCYTCELQERHKQPIIELARELAPKLRVRVEGVEFFADAAARHVEIFEKYYRGDLLTLRHSLLGDDLGTTDRPNGLRIAMATQFGEDAGALRMAALTNLLRLTLLPLVGKTRIDRRQLQERVSGELGLAKQVNAAYLDAALSELEKLGELQVANGEIQLSPPGAVAARSLVREARNRLLDGRLTFRKELDRAIAVPVEDRTFDDLWVRLQDALAELFLHEGMALVRAILDPVSHEGQPALVDGNTWARLALRIIPSQFPKRDSIIMGTAVLGVVTGETKTRAWLSQVAATFVSICALGLHPEAQEELLNRLRSWSLIVDNHVALSFLCRGESDHDGVIRVIQAWRKLGRDVATSTAVLEEAAYHAFIAEREYQENWRQLGALSREQAAVLIKNAFVRAFHCASSDGYELARWRAFIGNFRGSDQFDGSKLKAELTQAGWKIIDDTKIGSDTVAELQRTLGRGSTKKTRLTRTGEVEWMRRDEWDARIAFAAVHILRKNPDAEANVIIVTKSRAIRVAADWLARNSLGKVSIMSVSALGYAMSLTPGLSISLVDIRELLFDRNLLARAFGRLESHARRLVDQDRKEGMDLVGRPQLEERMDRAVADEFRRIEKTMGDRNRNARG